MANDSDDSRVTAVKASGTLRHDLRISMPVDQLSLNPIFSLTQRGHSMSRREAQGFVREAGGVGHGCTNCRKWLTVIVAGAFYILGGCNKRAPASDATPPTIQILKWEKNQQGGQGAQTTIQPGGQFTVDDNWLGTGGATNKADIRVYGDDPEGVRHLEVSGSAKGKCSTDVASNGQFFTSSGPLTASFPKQSETATAGFVKDFIAIHLDGFLAKPSCGMHRFANMPSAQEFFLDAGTWTINAPAENCCGGTTTATFTITVQ
jgi:hypothetical protein